MYCTDEAQVRAQDRNAVLVSRVQNTVAGLAEVEREQRIETERETEQCDPTLSIFQMYRRGPERFGDIQTFGKQSPSVSNGTQKDSGNRFACVHQRLVFICRPFPHSNECYCVHTCMTLRVRV